MAFRVPSMPLAINIWRYASLVANPPDVVTTCCLSVGKRSAEMTVPVYSNAAFNVTATSIYRALIQPVCELLVPALTDIQPFGLNATAPNGDCAEVPAGSGRYYVVVGVEDVAKGFANEYRLAWALRGVDAVLQLFGNPWGCPYASYPLP